MRKSSPTTRARLSIDIDRSERRNLRMAAARADQSLRDYVWDAVRARIRREDESGSPESLSHDPVLEELWNNPQDAIYDRV